MDGPVTAAPLWAPAATVCVVDWAAFALAAPCGSTACVRAPAVLVTQACVHEHIATARVCRACLSQMIRYAEPDEWSCGPCIESGHHCPAPLIVTEPPEA